MSLGSTKPDVTRTKTKDLNKMCFSDCMHNGNPRIRVFQITCCLCIHKCHADCAEKECRAMPDTVMQLRDTVMQLTVKFDTVISQNDKLISTIEKQ